MLTARNMIQYLPPPQYPNTSEVYGRIQHLRGLRQGIRGSNTSEVYGRGLRHIAMEKAAKMNAKRGYVPEDEKNFSLESIERMQTALRHVVYLINEGYGLKQAATFVGNHFLLSERQRLGIMRSVATNNQLAERASKQISTKDLSGKDVWIDGFNTIITFEVMLCDSIIFDCMDDTIRDLAALRGTYRLIPETSDAIRMMFDILQEAGIHQANILLDEPVSNSGRLKSLFAEIAEDYTFKVDVRILKDVDRALYDKEYVITSDSIIMDHCISWFNMAKECLRRNEIHVHVIKLWGN